MGSSPSSPPTASPAFLAAFSARADGNGVMPFAAFVDLALYHPVVGYYRRHQPRIGYAPGTDFFTASSSPVFGELVAAACAKLLRAAGRDPGSHTFVEIGAEPAGGVLREGSHPFARSETRRVGDPLDLTGDCVVFSNELFDAQPFTPTVCRDGRWWDVSVQRRDDCLHLLEGPSTWTGAHAPEGYRFDRPHAAVDLARDLAARPWRGLFVAFDYGRTLRELLEECPGGTARAYHRHQQSNDLLARPGEQDLTCHVCWDWLSDALVGHGFTPPALEFQEAFFIHHAGSFIASAIQADAAILSRRKQALLQLLHPAHLGQKFQVLHALRLN